MTQSMTEKEELSNIFDEKLRKYEDSLVEIILNISQSKRANPKVAAISCYLLIHGKLTQKEIKELTGFSMGTISTYLSVMTGTGFFQKHRIEGTHTFEYSYTGELDTLTTTAVEVAINSVGSLITYLKNKNKDLDRLIEKSKKGAKYLSLRIEELINSFEIYKKIFESEDKLAREIDEKYSAKSFERLIKEGEEEKEKKFDPEVYDIEEDILNQLLASQMFSTRDPTFIRILGYFITRKYVTQKTLHGITGLSVGKISEEVNRLFEDELIYKAHVSSKGKITYGADSLILLRFSRYIINSMTKWVDKLESTKVELENKKSNLEDVSGYSQIYKIYNYTLDTILKYKEYIHRLDNYVKF